MRRRCNVKVKYPDSLTTWSATARVLPPAINSASAIVNANQAAADRALQAPRFFVVGDQVTVSAVINNNTDQPMRVSALHRRRRTDCVADFVGQRQPAKVDQSPG
jgi:uncharacterized protein YfaS (alpha-2-macroglobulin family)